MYDGIKRSNVPGFIAQLVQNIHTAGYFKIHVLGYLPPKRRRLVVIMKTNMCLFNIVRGRQYLERISCAYQLCSVKDKSKLQSDQLRVQEPRLSRRPNDP